MVGIDELANLLFNRTRAESEQVSTDATTHTYIGTATSDSTNGLVQVSLDGYETLAEDTGQTETAGGIMVPCSPNVKKGDSVVVTAVGGGVMKAPMVVSASGSGDRQQGQIGTANATANAARTTANAANSTANAASTTANSAASTASSAASTANSAATAAAAAQTAANAAVTTANATAQHFWHDNNGVHVSSVAGSADGTMNTLWNSLGMLFRKGANNLLSLVTGDSPGVHIYDGAGNAAANIVASFTSSLIDLGRNSVSTVIRMCGGVGHITASSVNYTNSITLGVGEPAQDMPYLTVERHAGTGDRAAMYVEMPTSSGSSAAKVEVRRESDGCVVELSGLRTLGSYNGSWGIIRPMGVATVSVTTPANGYTTTACTFGSDITMANSSYIVSLTPEGAPSGYTQVAYTVTSKTRTGFNIYSYNDYSAPVTQTIHVMVVHA